MPPRELPGFYFDEHKNRYFPLSNRRKTALASQEVSTDSYTQHTTAVESVKLPSTRHGHKPERQPPRVCTQHTLRHLASSIAGNRRLRSVQYGHHSSRSVSFLTSICAALWIFSASRRSAPTWSSHLRPRISHLCVWVILPCRLAACISSVRENN